MLQQSLFKFEISIVLLQYTFKHSVKKCLPIITSLTEVHNVPNIQTIKDNNMLLQSGNNDKSFVNANAFTNVN